MLFVGTHNKNAFIVEGVFVRERYHFFYIKDYLLGFMALITPETSLPAASIFAVLSGT